MFHIPQPRAAGWAIQPLRPLTWSPSILCQRLAAGAGGASATQERQKRAPLRYPLNAPKGPCEKPARRRASGSVV